MAKELRAEQRQENKKLEVFIGRWQTSGEIYEAGKVTGRVDAIDTYEWLHGEYAMIHYADSSMGEQKVHGIEIIGYDPSREAYFAPFFDDQGSVGWEEIRLEEDRWTWRGENVMGVKYHRCVATFIDLDTITAKHEKSSDGKVWDKWMEIGLKRMEG